MALSIRSRLEQIEARLSPKPLEPFWIGLPVDTIEGLQRRIAECKAHNVPGCMVAHFPYWNAAPDATAAAMLKNYQEVSPWRH